MADLAAVGYSASAPKSKVMKDHDEVFDNRVTIKKIDDGTFHISAAMRAVPKKGAKTTYPCWCPDKELSADTLDGVMAKLRDLFG